MRFWEELWSNPAFNVYLYTYLYIYIRNCLLEVRAFFFHVYFCFCILFMVYIFIMCWMKKKFVHFNQKWFQSDHLLRKIGGFDKSDRVSV